MAKLMLFVVLLGAGVACGADASSGKVEAKVAAYKGRNVFFINGLPAAPLMYSGTEHSRDTWGGQPRQSLADFTAQGYDIIQTDMWFKYSLRPDGTFDMDGIRKQLAGILAVNPHAKIVVRINVSAPHWWLEKNPTELCKVTATTQDKIVFGGNSAESLASEKYAAFAAKNLQLFLTELAKTPEGDRVMGFHIGGGGYGEWHYYGIYQEPDASAPMRQKFAAFAQAKYQDLDHLNAAWLTTFKTWDEIVVPSYDRRYALTDGDFRDPQRDRYVLDYYDCQHATVSALVNGLARLTKETWPRPAVVGLFYGYFYGNWTVGSQASQFDIKTLFNSPYVDYFAGPYASRNMYGSGMFRSLAASVAPHGKVWISEHDGGTHLGEGKVRFPDLPRNEAESIARMRRNFMYTLTENAGQWWYDFGPQNKSGWWSTPALLAEARDLRGLTQKCLETPFEKHADVLVVYDMDAYNYVRPARIDKLSFKATEALSDSLLGTGAALDRIFLMDLPRVDLARYKLVIFANTFVMDEAQRALIRDQVSAAGRAVVFMSGAGYTDGRRNDPAFISDLVGLHVEKTPSTPSTPSTADASTEPDPATVTLDGQAFTLDTRGLTTRFKVADPGAAGLGTYGSGPVCAAVKTVRGCRIYYFGVPLAAPLPLFKTLLAQTHVRTYVENTGEKDYVAVGGDIIAIYSVTGGERILKPLDGASLPISLPPLSTQYFDIHRGLPLNSL